MKNAERPAPVQPAAVREDAAAKRLNHPCDVAGDVAKSVFHQVGALRIHARVAGAGRDVVLVHGLVASHRYWEPTLLRLSAVCRAWAPDLPGHGRSDDAPAMPVEERAEVLLAWMDAAKIRRAHLIGNSAGCLVAAAVAERHPDRVDHLVLQGAVRPRAPPLQAMRWAGSMLKEPSWPLRVGLQDARHQGLFQPAKELRLNDRYRLDKHARRIQVPTLVVRGKEDALMPRRWTRRVVRRLPKGRLTEVPASHIMNTTQPDMLVAAVAPFLELPAGTQT